jgi:hypothetical protein
LPVIFSLLTHTNKYITRITTFCNNKIQDYTDQDYISSCNEASPDVCLTTCFLFWGTNGTLVCLVGNHHHSVPFCIIVGTQGTVTLV